MASNLPSGIPEILRTGLSGLCFLLSLLAFQLIAREQKNNKSPRRGILQAVYVFMAVNLLTAVLVGGTTYLNSQADPELAEELAALRAKASELPRCEKKGFVCPEELENRLADFSLAENKIKNCRSCLDKLGSTIRAKGVLESAGDPTTYQRQLKDFFRDFDTTMSEAANDYHLIDKWAPLNVPKVP